MNGNRILEQVMKITMNSLFGQSKNRDIYFNHDFKIERWMKTEYDDIVEIFTK